MYLIAIRLADNSELFYASGHVGFNTTRELAAHYLTEDAARAAADCVPLWWEAPADERLILAVQPAPEPVRSSMMEA
jgi:hypothetical protein